MQRERDDPLLLSADWVIVDPATIVAHGAVVISDGCIAWVGPKHLAPGCPAERHLSSAVVLPGLVNAHAHLDLTLLGSQISGAGGLIPWLLRLVPRRAQLSQNDVEEGVRQGAHAALAGGTTTVGDIDSFGFARSVLEQSGLRAVALREVLGSTEDEVASGAAMAEQWLTRAATATVTAGLSPHAPYSTAATSYRRLSALAGQHRSVLATHLSETREECELLERGTGPFVDLLQRLGAPAFASPRQAPVVWLRHLGVLSSRTTLIHANYLNASEIECLAASGAGVVYCPRSHAFFGHERHPVRALLDAGVPVALGTDSLASNQSLSMLDELAFLHRTRPDLEPSELLRMATLNGARVLNLPVGELSAGRAADLIAVRIQGTVREPNVLGDLVQGGAKLVLAMVGGRTLVTETEDGTVGAPARPR